MQRTVMRYDGLTTVPHPLYCLAVPRHWRIILVGLEFIVSGGLGWCVTMTKLTVESLSRIHSPFPYLRIPFKVTQIQEYLFYHDSSLSTTITVDIRTPSQLWQWANYAHVSVSLSSSCSSPIFWWLRGMYLVIDGKSLSVLSFVGFVHHHYCGFPDACSSFDNERLSSRLFSFLYPQVLLPPSFNGSKECILLSIKSSSVFFLS
jgi:hypothetical protein